MEKFKIEHFIKDNPGVGFPHYRELPSSQCHEIVDTIAEKYNIKANDSLELVNVLAARRTVIEAVNAEDISFDLCYVFKQVQVAPLDMIFINWYRYDRIDTMLFSDLVKYFNDIWYPSADDIDIFDSPLDWILSIDHEGYVWLLRKG